MKGHTLFGTMIDSPLDVNTVIRVPIVLGIRRRCVREVVTGFKGHVALTSRLVLGIVGKYISLFRGFGSKETMRESVTVGVRRLKAKEKIIDSYLP